MFVIISICIITNILFIGLQRYVVYQFGFYYLSLIIIYAGAKKMKVEKKGGNIYGE